jgi:hypothetical protein
MINQKPLKRQQMTQQNKGVFKLVVTCIIIFFISCNDNKITRIKAGEFEMEGKFLDDSIPTGLIKYYKQNNNNLIATREFNNGTLNGASINYYGKKIIQIINYKDGLEFGFKKVFDSISGSLINSEFFYYGKKIGPTYEYSQSGTLLNFDFRNFENETLYSVEYDSLSNQYISDKAEKLVNLNVDEAWVNNEKKLRIFFYNIFPPKASVNYKICYFDETNNIIDSIKTPKRIEEFFWEKYIDYAKNNQKLAFIVTRYDSTTNKSQSIINYIKSIKDSK